MTLQNDVWQAYDSRFPANESIFRTPPDPSFVKSVREYGILMPILMAWLEDENAWEIVAGRKRLLAARQVDEEMPINVVIFTGLRRDVKVLSIIENAQRSPNPISDYMAITALLRSGWNYANIAQAISKTAAYVKQADEKFANVPDWALAAALDGSIALSVVENVGKLAKSQQDAALAIFQEKKALPQSALDDMRSFQKQQFSIQFSAASPQSGVKRVFSRADIERIRDLLASGNTKGAKAFVNELLG